MASGRGTRNGGVRPEASTRASVEGKRRQDRYSDQDSDQDSDTGRTRGIRLAGDSRGRAHRKERSGKSASPRSSDERQVTRDMGDGGRGHGARNPPDGRGGVR